MSVAVELAPAWREADILSSASGVIKLLAVARGHVLRGGSREPDGRAEFRFMSLHWAASGNQTEALSMQMERFVLK